MDERSVVSVEEFAKIVASKDYIALVRHWQELTFYVALAKSDDGVEKPALVDVHDHLAFIVSPDPVAVEAELEDFRHAAGQGDIVIKPVLLKDLARDAAMLGAWIFWVGSGGGAIVDSIVRILGLAGIARNELGVECLYRAEIMELPANEEMGTGPVAAQRWTITRIVDDVEAEPSEVRIVYEDAGVILLNPELDMLNGPKPRSRLSPGEQVLFDWWRQPLHSYSSLDTSDVSHTPARDDASENRPYMPDTAANMPGSQVTAESSDQPLPERSSKGATPEARPSREPVRTRPVAQASIATADGNTEADKRFGRNMVWAFAITIAGLVILASIQ
ncbi:hypothetical protein [Marinobacter shengliensis]|uniref:hypothetical protein n=1 Tax=Marinobacter shengliensis TaxID=1389223 RepID=UPI0035B79308